MPIIMVDCYFNPHDKNTTPKQEEDADNFVLVTTCITDLTASAFPLSPINYTLFPTHLPCKYNILFLFEPPSIQQFGVKLD